MSTDANKAVVRRFYEEIFNKRNLALVAELTTPEAISHESSPGLANGPEGVRQVVNMLSSAFPDHHTTIEDMVAEGDKVAVSTTLSGTHQGGFMGLPPTGKRFSQRQYHILRVADGKIAEHWAVRDDLGMMQQLGAIPEPGR
jgi:steroid delta-isomerase-like uncharacterized protein